MKNRFEEATTASIEALKAYSATRAPGFGGCDARIPLLERAVELDPEFALAHAGLGPCYSGTGRRQLAIQSATRAYELRQRTTDPERFFIEYAYDRDVTGDLERAFQTVTLWTQTYPRDLNAHGLRGGYSAHGTGRYEDVIQSAERALAIDPDFVFAHSESVSANMFLDRFDAAKRALQRAGAAVDPPSLALGYYIAMLEHDTSGIERLAARFKDSSDPQLLRHAQSLALARAGQLERARTLGREAIDASRSTRPTRDRGDLRIGGGGVGSVVGKSVNGQAACGDGPQDVECTRRQLCHRLRAGPRGGDHTIGITGKRSRAPISTRYGRQIHVCADAARARGSRAQ